jgi:soluble lytic murein transglycosylase-like protein/LysM repeat protein
MAIFLANPQRVHAMTKHARPFLHLIVEELERRHLPMELALLPAIESGYVGNARSPSAAAGIWQFIPATGRTYGLENDRWVDGRRDVTDSTAAALQYLQRLHTRFNGDWLLAIAAYNCGAKTVDDAMAANRAGGRPTDFWSLKGLPEQTRRYVPKLLAFAKIIKIPALYHQVLEPIPNRQYVTRVEVDGLVGIAHLAQASGLSEGEFRTLNPAFKKGALPPAGHPVLVPVQHVGVVKDMASRLPDKNSEEAARNLAEAEAADRPVKKDRIKTAGKEKRDPSAKDTLPLLDAAEETLRGSRGHRAHRRGYGSNGEGRGHARSAQAHLAENAPHDKNSPGANFRVSPEGVRRKDAPNKNAKKDQPLLTGVKTFLKPSEEQHRIRKGDTLLTIAKHYHIPVAAIQKENKLANTALREGNVLRIPHSDPRSNSGG